MQYTGRLHLSAEVSRRHDKTHWVVVTFVHWHPAKMRHHATKMPGHCLLRLTRKVLPQKTTFHNPKRSRCTWVDTQLFRLNSKTCPQAPLPIGIWLCHHPPCCNNASSLRRDIGTLQNRQRGKPTQSRAFTSSHWTCREWKLLKHNWTQ